MKIKTVVDNSASAFDAEVNAALDEGWRLMKREVLQAQSLLYAELVMLDPEPEPQEIDPVEAAHAVHAECSKHESCTTCPLVDFCTCVPPHEWGKEAEA